MTDAGSSLFVMGGLEYLVLAIALVGLFYLWRYMQGAPLPLTAANRRRVASVEPNRWFSVPVGYHFHPGHAWVLPEAGDVARVGMDDFAHKLLGRPEAVKLPRPGTLVSQGEVAMELRTHDRWVPVLSPVDGTVVEVNRSLRRHPMVIGDEPYDGGWLFKVRSPELRANLKGLLTGEVARSWMETTTRLLRTRLAGHVGAVAQDGGVPVAGFATGLPDDDWDRLVREFMLTG